MSWNIRFTLQTNLDAMRAVRKCLGELARLEGGDQSAAAMVEIAVGEALNNARLHAYGDGEGPIAVEVGAAEGRLRIVVHDSGATVTPPPPIPRTLPEPGSGRRGLYIIGQMMDRVGIEQPGLDGRGVALHMEKELTSSA